MKNKTFTLKYLVVFALAIVFSSCDALLDQDERDFGQGSNVVGFANNSTTLAIAADGTDVTSGIPIYIIGPSVSDINSDITVSVSVDPSSTAVEGINYRLESNTVTLSPNADNLSPSGSGLRFEGMLPVTIITEGIMPPVDTPPVINLNITDITSTANVVINDKTDAVAATIGYACPFDINNYEGTYLATTDEFGIYIGQPMPFEVVAGPGANQITLVDVAAHPEMYDVIVDVDPATGDLTIPKQVALNFDNLDSRGFGEMSWEGSGSSGSTPGNCIGVIDFSATYTVGAGSFGAFKTIFEKQ